MINLELIEHPCLNKTKKLIPRKTKKITSKQKHILRIINNKDKKFT